MVPLVGAGFKPAYIRTALICHSLQNIEEPVDVLLGIVEVGRDAYALAANADEDVVSCEPGGEVIRGVRAEHQPDHVPRPPLFGDRRDTELSGLRFYEIRQRADCLRDVLDFPLEELAQRLCRHREQGEVAPFPHVVAPGAWLEGVLVRNQPREVLASTAVDPVVLYWLPLPILLPDIHIPDTIGSEQPLVRCGDKEVGPDLRDVEGI